MKKILKLLSGRLFIFISLFTIQIGVLIWFMFNFIAASPFYLPIMTTLGFVSSFIVISRDDNPVFKMTWIFVILLTPIIGVPFYMLFGNKRVGRRVARQMEKYQEHYEKEMRLNLPESTEGVMESLVSYSPHLARQASYIRNITGADLWERTAVDYFPLGEDVFADMLNEVDKAKKFILIEYFIIDEGLMWETLLEKLQVKLSEGVDIRIMYDDLGCMNTLPNGYEHTLRKMGFSVAVFNRVRPHLNAKLNYRDHRKIFVIDGNVGFTGGINIADEYINRNIRFGHWKDTTVKLTGDAVWNVTLMFFQQWTFTTGEEVELNKYVPTQSAKSDGFVQPFGDTPLDKENVSENAYIQIINHAKKYVWITTPYLILDPQMITALSIAAESGVDVRIITPHMPDKWYVHTVSRSYYQSLLESGVKICEYTPGFMHAKMFVSDDEVAIVGTTNMDFRSFYLHFECGVAFYKGSVVKKVRDDIAQVLELSTEITLLDQSTLPLSIRLGRSFLKIFSPLM
ncbi:MAG: cardiolipin synthase [Sphaerochaetaceae bacterium]|jgi:cardiolipin synthase